MGCDWRETGKVDEMADELKEDEKTTVLARIGRLRELIEEDAETPVLERAYHEIGMKLDQLIGPNQVEGNTSIMAGEGDSPPDL
jgi:hypothetical protein